MAAVQDVAQPATTTTATTAQKRADELPARLRQNETCLQRWCNLGDMSNLVTLLVLIIGVVLEFIFFDDDNRKYNVVFAFGLYGFAGGITNWLAIKMLFEKIPGVHGSGVIPERFIEIRTALKNAIMDAFFEEVFLENYLKERAPVVIQKFDVKSKIVQFFSRPNFDEAFAQRLESVAATPQGAMLNMVKPMVGGNLRGLVPMLKPMMVSVGSELSARALANVDISQHVDVSKAKREVDDLMNDKLQLLTPEIVKEMMDGVIRQHLGWLIVWGNLFGGLIGIAANVLKILTK